METTFSVSNKEASNVMTSRNPIPPRYAIRVNYASHTPRIATPHTSKNPAKAKTSSLLEPTPPNKPVCSRGNQSTQTFEFASQTGHLKKKTVLTAATAQHSEPTLKSFRRIRKAPRCTNALKVWTHINLLLHETTLMPATMTTFQQKDNIKQFKATIGVSPNKETHLSWHNTDSWGLVSFPIGQGSNPP